MFTAEELALLEKARKYKFNTAIPEQNLKYLLSTGQIAEMVASQERLDSLNPNREIVVGQGGQMQAMLHPGVQGVDWEWAGNATTGFQKVILTEAGLSPTTPNVPDAGGFVIGPTSTNTASAGTNSTVTNTAPIGNLVSTGNRAGALMFVPTSPDPGFVNDFPVGGPVIESLPPNSAESRSMSSLSWIAFAVALLGVIK